MMIDDHDVYDYGVFDDNDDKDKHLKTNNKNHLKVRSRALNTSAPVSLFSASSTSFRKLSYITGSKKAKSWKRMGRPRMYLRTWRFR